MTIAPAMNDHVAGRVLRGATVLWFAVAVAGQLMFAAYVAGFYGGAAWRGDLAAWNKVMTHGYDAGAPAGNVAMAVHLLSAVIITVGGALQLLPQIRQRMPGLHRWTGRVYVMTACVTSLIGLYLLWFRGAVGDVSQHLGTSLNGVLIIGCAVVAWRTAARRQFAAHERWALRLYLVANGVWFFRVGLMFWLLLNRGPVGFDAKSFTGPFLTFLAFANYLLPLAVLELYLRWRSRAGRFVLAGLLLVLTVMTGAGTLAATMGMWLPRL